MTTALKIESSVLDGPYSAPDEVQFIPCSITDAAITETVIKERFTNFTTKDEDKNCLVNTLRGRPLEGKVVELPTGYTGLVVEGNKVGLDMDRDRTMRVTSKFREMTYWNYDKVPDN